MKSIRKSSEIFPAEFEKCHDGNGTLLCHSLLDGLGGTAFAFMHSDTMPAGVSIGVHTHDCNEEIYYLLSGKGVLTFDSEQIEMAAGDISLCTIGHSHGFEATENCILIVVRQHAKTIKEH